ncbi:ABC transporter ATP-binding protein [Levilactobacillus acidifarinae]|uniref:Branched-chain amino acid ABC transporter, ATP-binding protein n=1 Tax=Levilactobacillus acidifarinae DSM 19394 = JCM 15949 TaxID=1423715 RepID=A0A0R1LVP3_9LACO|nr:ABC transporter ATP-binding protein [Levilactobacillus acidifarinae]KRK96490.1 branched-chain amino acid ABC transporter, ATP-binding protein [Levilactobacillus acidifarinae DSM 19394]GEO68924.1 ABC transporter ATP-binding protein [Levilactobacillus acidifarinae]
MLKVKDLVVNYGAIQAVKRVSFNVQQGEIVTLIGANGAGKSTLLHTISGLMRPSSGSITYLDQPIQKLAAPKIVRAGISQVPEGRHVFPGLSVQENLQMGAFLRQDHAALAQAFEEVYTYFPILKKRRHQDAATLSGGEQQMLAMGRALMAKPKLMLLDEPSMGLAPLFISEIFDIIQAIHQAGTTVLLIEQNAKQALKVADRGYVLASGQVKLSGTGAELLATPAVQQAYLGG